MEYNAGITTPARSPARINNGDFGVGLEKLASMFKDHDLSALEQYGGASLLEPLFGFVTLMSMWFFS